MSFTTTNTTTNKKVSAHTSPIVDLEYGDSYLIAEDEPGKCVLLNATTDIDKPEAITYQTQPVKSVAGYGTPTNPSPNSRFMQTSVKVSNIFSTFSDTATSDVLEGRVDDQLTMTLSFKYPVSGYVKTAVLEEMLSRLLGAIYKQDGSTRFNDLIRGAMKPREL